MKTTLMTLAALALSAPAAFAHATLEQSEVTQNARERMVLRIWPGVLFRINDVARACHLLRYADPVDAGVTATDVEARAQGPDLIITAPDGLAQGTHALSWRVVSDDGQPVGGTHVFSIGFETGAPEAAPAAQPWPAALWSVPLASLAVLCGQAMDLTGDGVAALGRMNAWAVAANSPFGIAAAPAVFAGLLAMTGHRLPCCWLGGWRCCFSPRQGRQRGRNPWP